MSIRRNVPSRTNQSHRRKGQALIEFAFVSVISVILMGIAFSFALMLLGANVLQQAVDVGAMELSRLPLPPDVEFPQLGGSERTSTNPGPDADTTGGANLFGHPDFLEQIFDEQYLVIDQALLSDTANGQHQLAAYFADKPLINRLLVPLMIFERVGDERLIRYPGAIVMNGSTGKRTVLIPIVTARDAVDGVETGIEWRSVVEEIRDLNGDGPMALSSGNRLSGVVALRINYPFHAGNLVAHQIVLSDGNLTTDPTEVLNDEGQVTNRPIVASDQLLSTFDPPAPYALSVPANLGSGRYGLGGLWIQKDNQPTLVRPYRKVLSAQAIYRREIFSASQP